MNELEVSVVNWLHSEPGPFAAVRTAHFLGLPWEKVDALERVILRRDDMNRLHGSNGLDWAASELSSSASDALKRCQSPIEQLFLATLAMQTPERGDLFHRIKICREDADTEVMAWVDRQQEPVFFLHQQMKVAKFRLDFALIHGTRRVAVECDGHDFHEKTKEQAARDKKRDRELTADGWRVLRFTGSEIHRDADRCAGEVVSLLPIPPMKEFVGPLQGYPELSR